MQGGMLLVSGNAYGTSNRYGSANKNKNHYAENVKRMRQIQRQSKAREAESHKPMKALWKSEKYNTVQSKIKQDIEKTPDAPRPHSACYLRAHSRSGPSVQSNSRPSTPNPPPPEKLTVPRAETAKEVKLTRHDFDFIKINGINAKRTKVPRSPSATALEDLQRHKEEEFSARHRYGEVPKYLEERKNKWKQEEEDRIANAPDPDLPPGHRMLPEAERRNTLKLILDKETELTNELSSLPLRMDTFRIRSQKQDIEKKLADIDEAKKIFSRPKVFVKIDS